MFNLTLDRNILSIEYKVMKYRALYHLYKYITSHFICTHLLIVDIISTFCYIKYLSFYILNGMFKI